jgi:natural resistance-associated macrophage protein
VPTESLGSTLLVTDFLAHTPPDIPAQNFGVPAEAFSKIPLHDRYIFQSNLPGPLAADQATVLSPKGPPKNPFTFSLKGQPFRRETAGGTVQVADSELLNTPPDWSAVMFHAVVPHLDEGEAVLLAGGIVGATVMPHAIYLHSGLTQDRVVPRT